MIPFYYGSGSGSVPSSYGSCSGSATLIRIKTGSYLPVGPVMFWSKVKFCIYILCREDPDPEVRVY